MLKISLWFSNEYKYKLDFPCLYCFLKRSLRQIVNKQITAICNFTSFSPFSQVPYLQGSDLPIFLRPLRPIIFWDFFYRKSRKKRRLADIFDSMFLAALEWAALSKLHKDRFDWLTPAILELLLSCWPLWCCRALFTLGHHVRKDPQKLVDFSFNSSCTDSLDLPDPLPNSRGASWPKMFVLVRKFGPKCSRVSISWPMPFVLPWAQK